MRASIRAFALVLALAFCVAGAGCYGQFAVTRHLYTWNGRVTTNKFANSAVFFVLTPIYGLIAVVDWIVLNPIEVFTGSNPAK